MQRRLAVQRPLLQAAVRAPVPAVVAPQVVAGLPPLLQAEVPQPLRPQAAAAVVDRPRLLRQELAPQVVAGLLPLLQAEVPQPLRPQAARLVERLQQNRTLGKAEAQEMPAAIKRARSPSSAGVIMAASGMGQNGTFGAVGGTSTGWANAGSQLQSVSYGFVAEPLKPAL